MGGQPGHNEGANRETSSHPDHRKMGVEKEDVDSIGDVVPGVEDEVVCSGPFLELV